MDHRHPKRRDAFTWGRVPGGSGTVTYNLFWRAPNGRLFLISQAFRSHESRGDIARTLRRLRQNLRVIARTMQQVSEVAA